MANNVSLDGVIPIKKPTGMTSHDVVARMRKILRTKKIGHTGTLDPDVTGVLPICVGKATRIAEYITDLPKVYQGQVTIGVSTTTEDFSGEIIDKTDVKDLTIDKIKEVFEFFLGEIEQIPPMYSSVKVNGKKLYELARQGKEIDREPRKVFIYNIFITNVNLSLQYPTIDFEVKCSKGTYIRTLCVDIGKKLGYPAHMSSLVRTQSGIFSLENSFTLEEVEQHFIEESTNEIITTMAESLPQFSTVQLSDVEIENRVFNGQTIKLDTLLEYDGIIKITNTQNQLVALYEKKANDFIAMPIKVFK